MLKELDRAIEHFKKLAMQEKANEIKQEIEDLIRKQDELNKQTEKKEESLFKKTQEQEKIKEDFHNIQSDLMELQEKNQDLENPEDLNTEEKEEEINESLKNSVNELKDNKLKKASKSQQNTKKQLEELAQQLEGLQNNNHQEQEDMENIRLLLEQLVEFSLNQEDLLNKLKKTNMQDPKFVNIGQEQRKLSDEILIIEDSLDALAMRQLMISNKINKEVQYIKRGLKKSSQYAEKTEYSAYYKFRHHKIDEKQTLLLDPPYLSPQDLERFGIDGIDNSMISVDLMGNKEIKAIAIEMLEDSESTRILKIFLMTLRLIGKYWIVKILNYLY